MVDAIVIGSGISGLMAAYVLGQQRKRVVLLDPNPLGGMITTKYDRDFILEQGPNVLLEKPEFSELIDEIGLRSEVIYPKTDAYRQYVWADGRAIQVPKSACKFIFSDLFSLTEKFRIIQALFRPGVFKPEDAEESVKTFFSRGLGDDVTARILDPVLKGIYGGSIETLSAAALFPLLWQYMQTGSSLIGYLKHKKRGSQGQPRTFVFRGGMATLTQRLREKMGEMVTVRPLAAQKIETLLGQGGSTEFRVACADGSEVIAPQLVIATAAREFAPLLKEFSLADTPAALAARDFIILAEKRRYAPLTIIHCASDKAPQFPVDSFGILFPEGTPRRLLGVMFNSLLFPHLAPPGRYLLTLCFGGIGALTDRQSLTPDKSDLAAICSEYLGISDASIVATHHWPGAIPQYEIGHLGFAQSIVKLEQSLPGLSVVTVDRGGVGVPDRIKSVKELLSNAR